MSNPREAAFKIIYKIDYEGAYSNIALKNGLDGLSAQDRALATRLVYGCVSMQLTLDYIISLFSKVKLKKLSKSVREILRLGIYQIVFMDKIPDSAAVNESVKLISKFENRSKGFVNAILRAVSKEKENIRYPEDRLEYLKVRYSFPETLCDRFVSEFGIDFAEELIKSMSKEPETVIRVNTLKTTPDELIKELAAKGVSVKKTDVLENGLVISKAEIGALDEFKKGLFTVQDTAAQLACLVLNPKPGEKVMDLCAAPGGKTTAMAELMDNKGSIVAFDMYPHKTELIEEVCERLGIDIVTCCTADTSVHKPSMDGTADKILVDVPCSGIGIIRRKPEIKWNREDISTLPDIQKRLLTNACKYLKDGGELVYSTCTIFKDENMDVVNSVMKENPQLQLVDISPLLPDKFRKPTAKDGYITLYPNTDNTDGFFICKLRKLK